MLFMVMRFHFKTDCKMNFNEEDTIVENLIFFPFPNRLNLLHLFDI